jgi:5-methyltetrahydrofolate--homocysteine methyltransferase
MYIVGELINASRKAVRKAISEENAGFIQTLAQGQEKAGANFIDVNAGTFVGNEPEYLKWLVRTVQEVTDLPCALDSPDPHAIEAVLDIHKGAPMINSISLEKERYDNLMPLVKNSNFKVVALCMSDEGMPETMEDRMKIADTLINSLVQNGVKTEQIFVDPLVQPLSVKNNFGIEFLNTVEKIHTTFDGIHTMCGLSNISYGLPNRKFLNQTFVTMAISKGLDGAIINPLDKKMMANIIAAETLVGRDNYCRNFLKSHRKGILEV